MLGFRLEFVLPLKSSPTNKSKFVAFASKRDSILKPTVQLTFTYLKKKKLTLT